jgi:uncharacterized protein DUF2721
MPTGLEILSAMITPAVLISASGTMVLSTSVRMARVVDRVRTLSGALEEIFNTPPDDILDARRAETEQQLLLQTRRARLIQRALTSFYVALCVFVGTTISTAISAFSQRLTWMPTGLGIFGMLMMFYGCVLLVRETRLALLSVDLEMEFVLGLRKRYEAAGRAPAGATPPLPRRKSAKGSGIF